MSESDSVLPPLYRSWLEPVLGPIRGEPRATCSKCAMANWPDQPPLDVSFDPHAKCCTYQPDVPNYNVGRILGDTNMMGATARRVLRQRITDKVGVTPLGVHVAPVYRTLYENAPAAFGRSQFMRCPYYVDQDGGMCGVWQHRESVCTTWFCKFDKGAVGKIYWQVITRLLGQVEMTVKLWAIREAGLSEEAQADLWSRMEYEKRGVRPPVDEYTLVNTVNMERYKKDWANYLGREEEFFVRCAELASGLSSEDVMRLGGMHVQAAVNVAKYAIEKINSTEIPERVTGGGMVYYQIRKPGEVRLRHQGVPLDWLDLDERLAHELRRFAEKPTREVMADLQAEGIPVDEETVLRLLQWQALIKP